MANLAELNARIEAMSRAAAEKQGKLKEFEEYNRSVGLTPQTSPSSFGVSTSGSSSGKSTTQKTQTSTGSTGADAIAQAMSQRAEALAARVQELNRLQEDLNARYAALQSGQSTETAEQLAIEQDRLNDRKVNYERDSAQYGMDAAYYDQILAAAPYIAVERQAEETGTSVSGGVQAMIDTMQQRVNQIDQRRKSVQEEQAAIEERVRLLQHNTALSEEERAAEQTAINQAVARLTGRQQNLMRDAGVYSEDARAYDDALIERAEQDMMDFAQRQMDAYYDETAMQEAYEGQKAALYAEWQELQSREQISGLYGDRTASDVWSEIQGLEDSYKRQKMEADEYWTGKQLQGLSEQDRENLETIVRSEFGETAFSRLQPGKGKNQEVSKAYQDLYEKYSYREVESYLQIVRRQENAKTGTIMQETVQKLTKEKPVAANVAIALSKIPATIGAAAEFAGQIVNNPAGYRTLDVFGAGNVLQNAGRTVQQTTVDEIKAKLSPFWGNVASGAYQLGMSTVDSLVAMGTGTGLTLAVNAATNTMQDITERGGTIGQALVGGVLAGAAEAVFEKVSIENFQALSQTEVVRTVRDWVGNVAKSIATNASEEMATEFANIVTDSFVMGEFSNYAEAVRDLMEQNPGMSEGEAKMRVAGQMGLQILESGASGAIMGGFFGLLGSGIGQRRTTLRDGMVSGAIAQGLGYEGSAAFDLAAGLQVQLNEGFEVSDEDLSQLIAANQVQAEQREAAGANAEQTAAATKTEDVLALPEAMGKIAEAMPEVQTETVAETSGEDENVSSTESVQEAETAPAQETQMREEVRQEVVAPTVQEAVREESTEGNIPARVEQESTAEGITEENTLRREAERDLLQLAETYQGEELQVAAQNLANDMRMAGETAYAEEIEATAAEMRNSPEAVSANDVTAPAPVSAVQERGVEYGGEESGVRLRDGSERNDGQSAGGQTAGVAEAAGRTAESAAGRNVSAGQSRDAKAARRIIRGGGQSTKAVTGAGNGSASDKIYVLEKEDMGPDEYEIVNAAEANGYRAVLYYGTMHFTGQNGKRIQATGMASNDILYISMNDRTFHGMQLANHEMFHEMARENPGLVNEIAEQVLSQYSEEELEQLMQAYQDLYGGVYDDYAKIVEELCADAYAGMDRVNLGRAQEAYVDVREKTGDVRAVAERRTGLRAIGERGVRETRAGPEGVKNAPAEDEAERFSMAGKKAETADREALALAQQMRLDGVDAAEIFRETGWYLGRDGKWRFEIDDSVMKLRDMTVIPTFVSLGELVHAPMLFEAYPDLSNMFITFERMEKGMYGSYNRQFDEISLSYELKSDEDALLSSLIHEVQHAIQERERFARGASVEYWERRIREGFDPRTAEQRREADRLKNELVSIRKNDPDFYADMVALEKMTPSVPRAETDWNTLEKIGEDPVEWQEFDARRDALEEKYGDVRVFDFMDLWYQLRKNPAEIGRSATDLYYDTAGEREARNVAARRKLSADERRSRMPDLGDENTVFAEGAVESFSLASGQSREQVEERILELEGLMENLMTEQGTMDPAEFNVRWFNFQMEKAALESELYDEDQRVERQRLREEAKAKRERDTVTLEKIEKYRADAKKYMELADKAETEYEKTEDAKFLESAKKYRDLQKEFRKKANDLQREIRGKVDVKNDTRVYKPTEAIKRTENRLLDLFKIQAGNRGEARQALTGVLLDTLERGYVGQEALEAVLRQMYRAGVDVVPAEEIYQDIAATLKGQKIYVSNALKSEYGDDWNNVRSKLLGLGIYTTSERAELGVDSVYAELAGQYPGVFDEENVDMRGMLDEMLEAASMGRATHMTLADSAAVQGLDSEEDFWNLYRLAGEELARFADAAGVESQVRSQKEWQIAMEQAEHSAKEKKILKASRERAEEIRKTEQGKRQAMIAKRQRVEQMDKLRRQIERLNRKVERNDQLTKVALSNLGEDVVGTAKLAMETVDLISNGFRKSTQKDLLALKESIGLAKDAPGFEEDALAIIKNALVSKKAYKNLTEGQIDEKAKARLDQALAAIDRLGKRQLTDMSIDDLSAMYDAIGAIIHEIDSIDNMLGEEWDRTVDEAANQIREEVGRAKGIRDNLRGKKISGARHLLAEESLSPSRMLARLVGYDRSGAMGKVIREFEQGDLAAMKYALDADLIFDRFLKNRKNREWLKTATGKNAKMVTVEIPRVLQYGEGDAPIYDPKEKVNFQVSQMMLVQMLLDLQNEANTRHAEKGGYTIPDAREYRKGNYKEAYNKGQTVMIPRERLAQIVKEHLSEEGQAYAKLLHRYYNGVGKIAINEVSQKLNGVDVARVRNYYPIHTDQAYRGQEYNIFDATLESMGSLKERQYSESPILLEDAADTFRHHRDQMARYVGYAVARRNFVAVLNHRNAGGITLRAEIEGKWGTTAGKYLDEFFRILETGQLEEVSDILSGLQSKYAGAVLSYNVGSMMKQLGALPMAGSTVGHGAILHGMLHPTKMGKAQREFIRKYTPYLDYRGKGYTYREAAEAAGKNIHSESLDKTLDYLMGRNWLEAMDIKVNTALWHAAEYAVRRDTKLKPGSQADIEAGIDPYYKAVAEVFNRMTHDTQTNYNMMARPPVLMKQGLVLRAFTMFRTDAYQVTGALRENLGAWQQARRNYRNADGEEAKTEAREQIHKTAKGVARTVTAVVGNAMISVIVDELRQLIRGNDEDYFDEEGKILWGNIASKLGKNVLMNIAGSFMFVEELAEFVEAKITGDRYYEPEVGRIGMVVDAVESLWNLGVTVGEVFRQANQIRKDDGDVVGYLNHEWDRVFGAVHGAAQDMAFLVGSPFKNFERTVTTALGWIVPEAKIAYNDMFTDYSKSLLRDMSERELPYGIDAYLRDNCSITDEAVRDEYLRLYLAVGDSMMPGAEAPDKIKVGEGDETVEQETTLSDRGWWDSKYREVMIDETKALIGSDAYKSLTDEEKAEALSLIDKYAEQAARQTIGAEADAWARNTMAARVDPADVAVYKAATGDMKAAESYVWLAESELTEAEAVAVLGVMMRNAEGHTAGYGHMQEALKNGLELTEWAELYAIDSSKVETLNGWMADGLEKETAMILAESTADLLPEDGKNSVSDMQKYRAIDASGMTEQQKANAIGVLLGTEMETESGNPSQYAKMLDILDDGKTITEYLDLKDADRVDAYLKAREKGIELETYVDLSEAKQVDNYLEAVELGLSKDSAYKAVMAVAALPELPEGESYDTGDRQAAAVAACKTVEEQIIAYAAYGNANSAKTNTAKFTAAAEYDVSPALYLEAREFVKANYNANGNSSLDQKEVAAGLRAMDLTNSQRAALFQLFGSSWKKNPFGNASSIRDAYQAAKE